MAAVLAHLRAEAQGCKACPLWLHATQTVFGAGSDSARVMLVGEQPGDAEDQAGLPFVGPAGKVLDQALAEAGLPRQALYLTNVVKHFKWELRGKRRMHKTPAQMEIDACHHWIEAEIATLKPALVVCLGATAAHALIDPGRSITELRGRILQGEHSPARLATVHPSYVLRVPPQMRASVYRDFVADLERAKPFLAETRPEPKAEPKTHVGPRL